MEFTTRRMYLRTCVLTCVPDTDKAVPSSQTSTMTEMFFIGADTAATGDYAALEMC